MTVDTARVLGWVGAVLLGLGVFGLARRRDRLGFEASTLPVLAGVVALTASLGATTDWILLVLVGIGVMASVLTTAVAECESATESGDVGAWTDDPDTPPTPELTVIRADEDDR